MFLLRNPSDIKTGAEGGDGDVSQYWQVNMHTTVLFSCQPARKGGFQIALNILHHAKTLLIINVLKSPLVLLASCNDLQNYDLSISEAPKLFSDAEFEAVKRIQAGLKVLILRKRLQVRKYH